MAEMKTVVVGDILIQDSIDRQFGEDPQKAVIWVKQNQVTFPIMLTKEQLDRAALVAAVNHEDIPELGSMTSINEFDNE